MSHLPTPPPDSPTLSSAHPIGPSSSTAHTELLDHIDALLAQYLTLLDAYSQAREDLSKSFSNGFMSLAQANFSAPSHIRRYGPDQYDERMKAMRRVEVLGHENEQDDKGETRQSGKDVEIRIVKKEITRNTKKSEKEEKEQDSTTDNNGNDTSSQSDSSRNAVNQAKTVHAREKTDVPMNDTQDNSKNEEEGPRITKNATNDAEATKEDGEEEEIITDPLRWYGVLVPPALRTAQSHFATAIDGSVPQLCVLAKQMRALESEIGRARKSARKLENTTKSQNMQSRSTTA